MFLTKSIKNLEKPKKPKKIADPNSPACTYMGLAILFFFGFLEVFLGFDQKYQKPRETKKNKIADPNSPACTYMGLAILFCFFCFLEVFLVLDQKYQKPRENQKKQKLDPKLVPERAQHSGGKM